QGRAGIEQNVVQCDAVSVRIGVGKAAVTGQGPVAVDNQAGLNSAGGEIEINGKASIKAARQGRVGVGLENEGEVATGGGAAVEGELGVEFCDVAREGGERGCGSAAGQAQGGSIEGGGAVEGQFAIIG